MSATTPTILIIDDDPQISEVTELILSSEGYQIITDSDGSYFSQENEQLPDLILLDLLISGTSGEVIAKQLKANPQTSHIPILFLSAQTPDEIKKMTKKCQVSAFLTKPYDIDELLAIVKRLLTGSQQTADLTIQH